MALEEVSFLGKAFQTNSVKINSFQTNILNMQNSNPGTFSLATNCASFALDTGWYVGMNIPGNLTTFGLTNPAKVIAWMVKPSSYQESSISSIIRIRSAYFNY